MQHVGDRAVRGLWWRRWRRNLRPHWRRAKPWAIVVYVLVAVALTLWGWELSHPGASVLGFMFVAMMAFFPGGLGPIVETDPWPLQVAKILGPLFTAYVALEGIVLLARERVQLIGIRLRMRAHIIVAGLGATGFRLATSLYEAGFPLVIVERNAGNPAIAGARERGMTVVLGDATDPNMLRNAGVDRARHLVALCGDDAVNLDVTEAARAEVVGRRGVLTGVVHVDDLDLRRALSAEVMVAGTTELRLEVFNVFELAARELLATHSPFDLGVPGQRPHVVIAGLEGVGLSLMLQVAREWRAAEQRNAEPLPLTLVDPRAPELGSALVSRYPDLERVTDLVALPIDLGSPAFQRGEIGLGEQTRGAANAIYVCMESKAEALTAAFALARHPASGTAAIVVAVDDSQAGFERALERGGSQRIHSFGVFSSALTPELLAVGASEIIARAKHDEYVRGELAKGLTPAENPSVAPWQQLPESLRDSNRRFADGIGAKLEATGCRLVPAPLADSGHPRFTFSSEEVEDLARMEHDRWVQDLLRDGWRLTSGPKDPYRKLHPELRSWEALSEEEREKDRIPVRGLPEMLARAGFEIQRPCSRSGGSRAQGPALVSRPVISGGKSRRW